MHNVQLFMKMDGNNETQRRGFDVEAQQIAQLNKELTDLQKELQAKNHQVKEYKKQVDSNKAELERCQKELERCQGALLEVDTMGAMVGRGCMGVLKQLCGCSWTFA